MNYKVKAQSHRPENLRTGQLANGVKPMMTETKQTDALVEPGTVAPLPATVSQPLIDLTDRPAPDILRVLAIGRPQVVQSFVMTLFRYGYAQPGEWSRQLPTGNPDEVMRILTKRVTLPD